MWWSDQRWWSVQVLESSTVVEVFGVRPTRTFRVIRLLGTPSTRSSTRIMKRQRRAKARSAEA